MYYLIYVVYAAAAGYAFKRSRLTRSSGLQTPVFIGLYLFTILCSIGFAYYFSHFHLANDYLVYNRHGWEEYQLLIQNPSEFFTNITDSNYANPYGNYFEADGSYWNDLRNNIVIKILALMNLLSQGNFYINTLFFSLISFWGKLALFQLFKKPYPHHTVSLIIGCFLLPSTCVFLSGIHKDALLFCLLVFFSRQLYQLSSHSFKFSRLVSALLIFLSILLLRNYVALALIPLIISWSIARKTTWKPVYIFLTIYAFIFIAISILEISVPGFRPLEIISQRQKDFLALPVSSTQLPMKTLEPTLQSFLASLPMALNHVFLHPLPGAFKALYLIFYTIENVFYILVFLTFCFTPLKQEKNRQREMLNTYFIFLALSIFLFIGFTIPAVGAIIRYKSLYLPFLISPILCNIDWKKIGFKSYIK